jgi:hypothetical protein
MNVFRTLGICIIVLTIVSLLAACDRVGQASQSREQTLPPPEPSRGEAGAEAPKPPVKGKDPAQKNIKATQQAATENTAAEQPKRIYSGNAELLVNDIEEAKAEITEIANSNDGYVESSFEDRITIRVPAEQFESIFASILLLGDILYKKIETIDVSEYFVDLNSRLKIAETTRERLYKLLETTEEVDERLKILQEIRRLTEEIERINLTLTLLEERVKFSRISLVLTSRFDQEDITREEIPFPWIAALEPLYTSIDELKGSVSLELGEEFAHFKDESIYRAESPEGTRVRMGSLPNKPQGDTRFWQQALHYHLEDFYAEAETMTLGEVQSVLFTSKDREPFYYLVGVTVEEETLYVIETFFPDEDAYEKREGTITQAYSEVKLQ